ncbi:MAG: proteasome assembly chaperone family protein [Candidatus Nanoarchaeia archaeon]
MAVKIPEFEPKIRAKPNAELQISEDILTPLVPQFRKTAGSKEIELKLLVKPKKGATVIVGFPGFGYVATIATEYLIDHLKTHPLGEIWSSQLTSAAFIHEGRVIKPIEIFHNDKYNILIIEALSNVSGLEWEIAEAVLKLCREISAKELICIEGVSAPAANTEPQAFYYSNNAANSKKLEKIGLKKIRDGVIFGVAGALLLKAKKDISSSFIFAETHSDLPDSRAAAKVIQVLDQYVNLKVDYAPLLKRAEEFEKRLQELIRKAQFAVAAKKEKEVKLPYIG